MLVVGVVIIAAVGVLVAVLATTPFRPVSRFRVERLARRESLPITVDNGEIVIRYLATTRRWRGSCLILGLVGFALYSVQRGDGLRVDLVPAFFGWFVGALVAEWRISTMAAGTRRLASLQPRRLGDYVSAPARWLAVTVVLAAASSAVAGIAVIAGRGHGLSWALVGLFATTVAVTAGIVVVTRHVLLRPQPLEAPDVVAADDALRSRSLHAIVGSAVALGGYLLAAAVGYVAAQASWFKEDPPAPVSVVLLALALPVAGVWIATATSKPRVRAASVRADRP